MVNLMVELCPRRLLRRAATGAGQNRRMGIARSVGLFIAAGLAEIGGGYLVWRWLRDGAPVIVGILGAAILVVYGVIPTLQKSSDFGRIYAAYGGVFVVASLLWGWGVDKNRPDRSTGRGLRWSWPAWRSSTSPRAAEPGLRSRSQPPHPARPDFQAA